MATLTSNQPNNVDKRIAGKPKKKKPRKPKK